MKALDFDFYNGTTHPLILQPIDFDDDFDEDDLE
jgi:hypothetical protein